MADNSEFHFEPEFGSKLLLEIAQEQSLDELLKKLVRRILDRPHVARVRIWLIEKGDLCSTCPRRSDCPDQTRCLHAVAGGGTIFSNQGEEEAYVRMTDPFSRLPIGVGIAGKIAATGTQTVLRDLDQDPGELSYIPWLKPEQVRG